MEITLIRQNTIIYQISDKTYEFERSLPVTIAFMTGTVQATICRHISVDATIPTITERKHIYIYYMKTT
jgi:hypothetical protein